MKPLGIVATGLGICSILLIAVSCGEDNEGEITPRAATPAHATEQPTSTVLLPKPSVAAIVPPEPTVTPTALTELTGMSWEEAVSHTGEWGTVCGPCPYARHWAGDRGQPTFITIGDSYLDPAHFEVVIWGEDRGNFPAAPEDAYPGNEICATGWIEQHGDAAQTTVSSPDDIVVLPAPDAVLPAREPQPGAPPTPPDLGLFLGGWGRHGFGITITASGEATAAWRVYKWCSDDPTPPCDAQVDSEIVSGGRAFVVFTRVAGETAYGWVKESTEPEVLSGRIALTLQPYGMALLEPVGNELYDYEMALCGPNFWQEAPEDLKQQSPCGA
jgi:hypothetical protein